MLDGIGDLEAKAADAGDQDRRNNEEVLVVAKIKILKHLQTGNGDEAVKCQADAAHDAGRDGTQERHGRAEEGKTDAHEGGRRDRGDRGILGDGHAADRLTVGGVRANAEDGTGDRADAVTEQGLIKTGILDQVTVDDRRKVLMVGNMLGKDDERHRQEGKDDLGDGAGTAALQEETVTDLAEGTEDENLGIVEERLKADELPILHKVLDEGRPVNDLEIVDITEDTDDRKEGSGKVAHADTEDEGDHTGHLPALLGRADDNGHEGHKAAEKCREVVAVDLVTRECVLDGDNVTHRRAGQRKTDERDRRPDDDGGHQLRDPARTGIPDDDRQYDVHKACHGRAEDDAAGTVGNGCDQRGDKCEGAAEKYRALKSRKELVNKGTDAGTEDRRRDLGRKPDDGRYCDRRRQNGQQLLKREDEHSSEFWPVMNVID